MPRETLTSYIVRNPDNSTQVAVGDPALVMVPNGSFIGLLRHEEPSKLFYAGEVRVFELMTQQGPALTVRVFPIVLANGPVTVEIPRDHASIVRVKSAVDIAGFKERFNKYYVAFLDPTLQTKNIHVPPMAQAELQSILGSARGGKIVS